MKCVAGEVHDPCVATYQTLEADQLNMSLKACGVSDASKRREIIEHFLFNAGYFRDSCWFEEDGRQFRPIVCFEEVGVSGESKRRLFVPDPSFGTSFHEYAHGAAAWVFEHGEDSSEIKTGDVSQ